MKVTLYEQRNCMALPIATGHLAKATNRQATLATVILTYEYLIPLHKILSTTTAAITQYHGNKRNMIGTNG
jgi:hypothetical protein